MSGPGRHFMASQPREVALGLALFVGGSLLLWDAYDRRGRDAPRILRPFTFW